MMVGRKWQEHEGFQIETPILFVSSAVFKFKLRSRHKNSRLIWIAADLTLHFDLSQALVSD